MKHIVFPPPSQVPWLIQIFLTFKLGSLPSTLSFSLLPVWIFWKRNQSIPPLLKTIQWLPTVHKMKSKLLGTLCKDLESPPPALSPVAPYVFRSQTCNTHIFWLDPPAGCSASLGLCYCPCLYIGMTKDLATKTKYSLYMLFSLPETPAPSSLPRKFCISSRTQLWSSFCAQLCPMLAAWSGLLFPSQGESSNPGIKPTSPTSPALAGRFFTTGDSRDAPHLLVDASLTFLNRIRCSLPQRASFALPELCILWHSMVIFYLLFSLSCWSVSFWSERSSA